eukprot:15453362-Alexandrium_andersonii.AAC.1
MSPRAVPPAHPPTCVIGRFGPCAKRTKIPSLRGFGDELWPFRGHAIQASSKASSHVSGSECSTAIGTTGH